MKSLDRQIRAVFALLTAVSFAGLPARAADLPKPWVSTWAASPGPRWAEELPAPFDVPDTLGDQTVRQIARISVGGDKVRVVLSNEFGTRPLRIGSATVAIPTTGSAVDPATIKPVTWNGRTSVVIPPGAPMLSDPVDLPVRPLGNVAVSIYLPDKSGLTSVHWDGRQTGFISAKGDQTRDADFKPATTTQSRLFLSGLMVDAKPASESVVFLADSITDGYCSTSGTNNRWPDHVAERLQAEGHPDVAVVNEAYSGDRVLTDGMGTDALARFDMAVLSHPRVSTLVLMMGINDIGWPGPNSFVPTQPEPTAADIEAGYAQLIARAHAHGIRIVVATLTPFIDTFAGTPNAGYYTPAKEQIRQAVNAWIRSAPVDGLIDFDKLLDDPAHPGHLLAADDCGDHLHPNDAGYRLMAKSVDLGILTGTTH